MTCSGEESSSTKVNQSPISLIRGWILYRQKQQFSDHHGGLFYILNKMTLESMEMDVDAMEGGAWEGVGCYGKTSNSLGTGPGPEHSKTLP